MQKHTQHNLNPVSATRAEVGRWAVSNGLAVPTRGPIPTAITVAFTLAYAGPSTELVPPAVETAETPAETPAEGAEAPQETLIESGLVPARSLTKISGVWHTRLMTSEGEPVVGSMLVVPKSNGTTATVITTGKPFLRKMAGQTYRVVAHRFATSAEAASGVVAPVVKTPVAPVVKTPVAPVLSIVRPPVKPSVPTFSDAPATGAVGAPIDSLVVNGNTMWTVTVGHTVRLFTTLAAAAAYAATA